MKKLLFISGVALLGLSPVIAQQMAARDAPQQSRAHAARKSVQRLSPEQRVDARIQRLDQTLDLSPKQKASIRTIYLNDAESRAERKMETQKKVDAVLTAEQKAKFSELQAERREAIKVRKSERGALKRAPGINPDVSTE